MDTKFFAECLLHVEVVEGDENCRWSENMGLYWLQWGQGWVIVMVMAKAKSRPTFRRLLYYITTSCGHSYLTTHTHTQGDICEMMAHNCPLLTVCFHVTTVDLSNTLLLTLIVQTTAYIFNTSTTTTVSSGLSSHCSSFRHIWPLINNISPWKFITHKCNTFWINYSVSHYQ